MLDFLSKEKGKLLKIGKVGGLVGANAGLVYIAAELASAYAGTTYIAMIMVGLNTVISIVTDIKKKQETYIDENDL